MIRVCLLFTLVACSKTPHASHEAGTATPVTRPIDAAVTMDAPVPVDAAPPADAAIDAGTKPDAGVKATQKLGKAGDVCAYGMRNMDPEQRATKRGELPKCGPGLICCYPCGIQGCDSICKATCPAVP